MKSNGIWILMIAIVGLFLMGANEVVRNRAWDISPIIGNSAGVNSGLETVFSGEALSFDTGQLIQTLARPLFATNRRPFVKKVKKIVSIPAPKPVVLKPKLAPKKLEKQKPKLKPNKPPDFQLAGILLGDGSKKAYLKGDSLGAGRWISDGENVNEWQVFIIDKNSVKLKNHEFSHKLKLYVNNGDN